jgi:hypothetical protein
MPLAKGPGLILVGDDALSPPQSSILIRAPFFAIAGALTCISAMSASSAALCAVSLIDDVPLPSHRCAQAIALIPTKPAAVRAIHWALNQVMAFYAVVL